LAHRRFASRRPKGPKNNVWTVVVQDEVSIGGGGALNSSIVQGSDWERQSGSSERSTLMSIRGWFAIQSRLIAGTANSAGSLHAYIGVFDEDETSPGADLASTYGDEDILWIGGFSFGAAGVGFDFAQHFNAVLDVKAQRKIRNGQKVVLSFQSGLTTSVQVSGVQRALLRIGGN